MRHQRNPLSDDARELALFIVNDGDLYRQQTTPIIENLARKIKKGIFKHRLAVKLFRYLADNGAKKYTFEFGDRGPAAYWQRVKGFGNFSVRVRNDTALHLLRHYFEAIRERAGKTHVRRNPDIHIDIGSHNARGGRSVRTNPLIEPGRVEIISEREAAEIRERARVFDAWVDSIRTRGGKGWARYKESDIPPGLPKVSNDDRAKLETFDFVHSPPERYFLYINEGKHVAGTWPGSPLGRVEFGRGYESPGFYRRSMRVPVTIYAINGWIYHGTYFKSAGDYARIKRSKKKWATIQIR